MESWRDGEMEKWRDGEMERWRNGEMEKWRDGEMEKWRDGEMDLRMDKECIAQVSNPFRYKGRRPQRWRQESVDSKERRQPDDDAKL